MWRPQIGALSGDYRLIPWDMRGHGQSDSPEDESRYSRRAHDRGHARDPLRQDRGHVTVRHLVLVHRALAGEGGDNLAHSSREDEVRDGDAAVDVAQRAVHGRRNRREVLRALVVERSEQVPGHASVEGADEDRSAIVDVGDRRRGGVVVLGPRHRPR